MTVLPQTLAAPLKEHLGRVRKLHEGSRSRLREVYTYCHATAVAQYV